MDYIVHFGESDLNDYRLVCNDHLKEIIIENGSVLTLQREFSIIGYFGETIKLRGIGNDSYEISSSELNADCVKIRYDELREIINNYVLRGKPGIIVVSRNSLKQRLNTLGKLFKKSLTDYLFYRRAEYELAAHENDRYMKSVMNAVDLIRVDDLWTRVTTEELSEYFFSGHESEYEKEFEKQFVVFADKFLCEMKSADTPGLSGIFEKTRECLDIL